MALAEALIAGYRLDVEDAALLRGVALPCVGRSYPFRTESGSWSLTAGVPTTESRPLDSRVPLDESRPLDGAEPDPVPQSETAGLADNLGQVLGGAERFVRPGAQLDRRGRTQRSPFGKDC